MGTTDGDTRAALPIAVLNASPSFAALRLPPARRVVVDCSSMASFATKKIYKAGGEPVSALEEAVAKAFVELEITSKEMSAELRDLYFLSAKEVEAPGNKTAIVVFVPFRQHKKFMVRRIEQQRGRARMRALRRWAAVPRPGALTIPPAALILLRWM